MFHSLIHLYKKTNNADVFITTKALWCYHKAANLYW